MSIAVALAIALAVAVALAITLSVAIALILAAGLYNRFLDHRFRHDRLRLSGCLGVTVSVALAGIFAS